MAPVIAADSALCAASRSDYHDGFPSRGSSVIPLTPTAPLPAGLLFALQDGSQDGPAGPNMLILLGIPLLIFWFVAIWPERKERKRKAAMIANLKKNDRVLTTGGMYATVAAVAENELTLKFDEGPTRVRVVKSAIASVVGGPSTGDSGTKG
jgi:preprotein translocase subunit YajC